MIRRWNHEDEKGLDDVLAEVDADERCQRLMVDLPKYAQDKLERHLPEIRNNLTREAQAHPMWEGTVDILWPGSGYNSAACGGNFEVLALLEREGMKFGDEDAERRFRIGRIMGASGGAASALLALSDPSSTTATFLRYYMAYAMWSRRTWNFQAWAETPLWNLIYKRCIADEEAFSRMREKGWVAVAKGVMFKNAVFHNFRTREQCVQAYYASGDMSIHGFARGTRIDGVPSTVSDGGQPSFFPDGCGALLYYNTSYDRRSALSCTLDSIEKLYRAGVDQTIQTLMSEGLHVGKDAKGRGGMSLRLPSESGQAHQFNHIKNAFSLRGRQTQFYDLEAGEEDSHRF